MEFLFLPSIKHILRIQDRSSFEFLDSLEGVLLEEFVREDVLDVSVEAHVVNHQGVDARCEFSLKEIEFSFCQENFLRVESRPEFLLGQVAFSQDIVVLEELKQSDSVLFNLSLYLQHQVVQLFVSLEVGLFSDIGSLRASLDRLGENFSRVSLFQESQVFDFSSRVSENLDTCLGLLVRDYESEIRKNLSELLDGDLEVFMSIPILEETLGIKSVLDQKFSEAFNNFFTESLLSH